MNLRRVLILLIIKKIRVSFAQFKEVKIKQKAPFEGAFNKKLVSNLVVYNAIKCGTWSHCDIRFIDIRKVIPSSIHGFPLHAI